MTLELESFVIMLAGYFLIWHWDTPFVKVDGFVKSPTSALCCIS